MLPVAVLFCLVLVLGLVSGPRHTWYGPAAPAWQWALLLGGGVMLVVVASRLRGPVEPRPEPSPGQRQLRDILTGAAIAGTLILILLRACSR